MLKEKKFEIKLYKYKMKKNVWRMWFEHRLKGNLSSVDSQMDNGPNHRRYL